MLSVPSSNAVQRFQRGQPFAAENLADQVDGKLIMAGWHRSVGCENTALAHRFAIRIRHRRQIAARDFVLQKRQSQERRVPLVHMVGADVFVTQRLEHRHAAHSQDDFLTEPMAGVAVVERLGQTLLPGLVFLQSGVEKIDRHRMTEDAAHDVAPSADPHRSTGDRHKGARHHRFQYLFVAPCNRSLGLIAVGVQGLAKIAFTVQQGDADHRQAEIGCRAQRVAGKDAEAAAIGRHAGVKAHFHGKVSDRIRADFFWYYGASHIFRSEPGDEPHS